MQNVRSKKRQAFFETLEARCLLSGHTGIGQEFFSTAGATPVATTSSNWSGYSVDAAKNSVTYVAGSWVVPAVTGTGTTYSSFWVGIDGSNSNTVEQLGTDSDVVNGKPQYYAWYEMYPKASKNITAFPVSPGDSITASVTYTASGTFQLQITDATSHHTFQTLQKKSGVARSSAEWVVEAPSGGGVLPLANFGTASFTGCSATINGITGPINTAWSGTTLEQINMVSGSTVEDTTGPLVNSGTGFAVTYVATAGAVSVTHGTVNPVAMPKYSVRFDAVCNSATGQANGADAGDGLARAIGVDILQSAFAGMQRA
jgi:hypothetical protein